jgi:hypothetical protein
MTSVPTLDDLKVRNYDPKPSSEIPTLSGTRKRARRRTSRPKIGKKEETVTPKANSSQLQDSKDLKKRFNSTKVIGDASDSENEKSTFENELKSKVGDNSLVISDSPTNLPEQLKKSRQGVRVDQSEVKTRASDKSIGKVDSIKTIPEEEEKNHAEVIDADTAKIVKLLSDLKYPLDELDRDSTVKFKCESLTDAELLYEVSEYKFPQFKKLEIHNMDELLIEEDVKGANDMMSNAITAPIKYLYLSGGRYCDLDRYKNSLMKILKLVTHQVFLSGFSISSECLETILEASSKTENLTLDDCKVSVEDNFRVSKTIEFKIKNLDLYKTLRIDDNRFMHDVKFGKLLSVLSETTLPKSLSYVHTRESSFPSEKLQKHFDINNFNVIVEGDERRKDSLSE